MEEEGNVQTEAQKKKDETEFQVNWIPMEVREQKQGKPEAREASTNCYTRLQSRICLSGSGTSVAILITSTIFERPTLLISKWSLLVLSLDLWLCGLVFFSVVAEYNICTVNHLLCCLNWRKIQERQRKITNQVVRMTEINSPIVLEARSLKHGIPRTMLPQ